MAEAVKTPNIVKACNKQGLYEELEDIQSRLSVCEKALAVYLETKRLAFPRFYFISSADLLDILYKGIQPVEVNIAKFELKMGVQTYVQSETLRDLDCTLMESVIHVHVRVTTQLRLQYYPPTGYVLAT